MYYCYMDDVLQDKGPFDPKKYNFEKDSGSKAIDPDKYSKKLYFDLATVFNNNNKGASICFDQIQNTEIYDQNDKKYGSDYIGPSWNYAKKQFGFTDEEIGKGLKATRILGGHTLWLRKKNSINQAKGSYGIYDRIDLCLDEIKDAYENEFSHKAKHSQGVRNAICRDKEWFELFENIEGKENDGFKNFIDFFMLQDYIKENNKVISLAISHLEENEPKLVDEEYECIHQSKVNTNNNCYLPGKQFGKDLNQEKQKQAYQLYVDNCIYLIQRRTNRMLNK